MAMGRSFAVVLGLGWGEKTLASWVRSADFGLCQKPMKGDNIVKSLFSGQIPVEELWRQFFSDPSEWWDHTSDFKHKKTGMGLWIDGSPMLVRTKLASMTPRSVPRSLFSWNALLSECVKSDRWQEALGLFQQMQGEGVQPDSFTFVRVLNACTNLGALKQGRLIHKQIIQLGAKSDLFVGNSLVDMYAKCGSIGDAWRVFHDMPTRNVVSWNIMLGGCVKYEQGDKALKIFRQMQAEGMKPDPFTFVSVLNACASFAALEEGRRVHSHAIQSGCELDMFVGNSLVDMYAKCGSIGDAWRVFQRMPTRNLVSWNSMLAGCVKCEEEQKALELFELMQIDGVMPNTITFVMVLGACAALEALEEGRQVHLQASESALESNVFVGSTLVDMYAKCGSIDDAWKVFQSMPTRTVVSWNAMLAGCVKCEQGKKALKLFQQMQAEGVKADNFTFVTVLNACASLSALEEGRQFHLQVIQSGCKVDAFVGNSLVNMYTKCGRIDDAWRVFHSMPTRDLVSWNVMLSGWVKCEEGQMALELFGQMQAEGLKPDPITFVAILNACASLEMLEEGRRVHAQLIDYGYERDMFVVNTLIGMYANCGSLEDASRVFHSMPTSHVVSWNAMLAGFVKCEQGQKALELFGQMVVKGVKPDLLTFVAVLNACASLAALEEGKFVHGQVIQSQCESHVLVGNTLVNMYAKCGRIDDAWRVFCNMPTHDIVSWNSILTGCMKCEEGQKVLELFQWMKAEGVQPDHVSFVAVIKACASLGMLEDGRSIHRHVIESGCESDVFVGSTLVDMFGKCGSIDEAWNIFRSMSSHNVVSWNAMLVGCLKCEEWIRALELFKQMEIDGVKPNVVTFVTILNACASLAALEEGRRVHMQAIQFGYEGHIVVGNTLVSMYAKCGSIEDAGRVFNGMPVHDMVSWTAMLGGLAMHGHGHEAICLFEDMYQGGVEMDVVTFICLLSACSHAGLVEEGIHYFESMSSVYGISPTVGHYSCLVDLLGRAGRLDEAEDVLTREPKINANGNVLMALLGACRNHGNVEMGERVAHCLLKLEPDNAAGYILLSDIYAAAAAEWDTREKFQAFQIDKCVKQLPGRTWIEVDSVVHSFVVDDRAHTQIDEIHVELQKLSGQMEEAGYVPDTQFVLHDVEEEDKILSLCHHSEKLAIAFGHISTAPGTPLRIYTNRRICVDCHSATKVVTKIVGREIVVRDTNRFHHVKCGVCSCQDYW